MLGSSYPSARKILALGTSKTFCNWKCTKNIWRHMIRLLRFSWCLRSSSLRVNSHLGKTVNHRLKHVPRFYQSNRHWYFLIYGITCSSEINFIVNFYLKSSNFTFFTTSFLSCIAFSSTLDNEVPKVNCDVSIARNWFDQFSVNFLFKKACLQFLKIFPSCCLLEAF